MAPTSAELDQVSMLITTTPLFIATLARHFPEHRRELNERAQRLNITRHHPYLLVKRAIEAP
jgi:hypothetical protein